MNETTTTYTTTKSHTITTKILAIIGFFATIALILWLIFLGGKYIPQAFSSLANIASRIQNYKPLTEITVTSSKEVVNSGESFVLSWADVQAPGTYSLSYLCAEGVHIEAKNKGGELVNIVCNETLSFPSPHEELTVSLVSTKNRVSGVTLQLAFANKDTSSILSDSVKMTVVNPTIPVFENEVIKEEKPPVMKPVVKPEVTVRPKPVAPIITTVYPQSNNNGFTDLSITTTGIGMLQNDVFMYTADYKTNRQNAIKFDIKNIGTKTSNSWTFTTTLPNGQTYTFEEQDVLKPLEHVEFTIGFYIEDRMKNDTVKITSKVKTSNDTNSKNDTSVWSVKVRD